MCEFTLRTGEFCPTALAGIDAGVENFRNGNKIKLEFAHDEFAAYPSPNFSRDAACRA